VDLDHLQLGGDEVEDLGHVLADQPQHTAAIGAVRAGIKGDALARCVRRDTRLAATAGWQKLRRCRRVGGGSIGRLVALRRRVRGRTGHLEALEGELQLRDLAVDLLRARPVLLPLQPGDGELECLDQRLVGPARRLHPDDLLLLREDDRLQGGGVVRQAVEADLHVENLPGGTPLHQPYPADLARYSGDARGRCRPGRAAPVDPLPEHRQLSCGQPCDTVGRRRPSKARRPSIVWKFS
jgi:hypothetical protein